MAAFVAGVLFSTAGANFFGQGDKIGTSSFAFGPGDTRRSGEAAPAPPVADFENAFVEVAERVNPTVVQIRAEKVASGPGGNPFQGSPFEDFFDRFNPRGEEDEEGAAPEPFRSEGLGSGVIAREDGYIITNNHVVEDAEYLSVVMLDGREMEAEIVGTDPNSDLAVIKVDADGLPAVSFATISDVQVGQWVMAFGSPLSQDLGNTVTSGIVSALGRYSPQSRQYTLQNFIQTDAAINPGNSGGPLVNLRGELVGINSQIYTRTGGNQGIGFAIPVNTVQNVTGQLIESGSVRRGRLGVQFRDVSESLGRALDLPRGAAQIAQVIEGTAADEAGLQEGDIIIALDGRELRDYRDLSQTILNRQPGEKIELTIIRDEEEETVTVTLGELDEEEMQNASSERQAPSSEKKKLEESLGFSYEDLANLSEQQARRLRLNLDDLESTEGVIVTDVDVDSPAFRDAGVRVGVVILSVDGESVADVEDFEEVYEGIEPGETFIVRLSYPGQPGSTRTALIKPSDEG
ncbi:MAG: Do family serine endopeptidase [Rhodothermales bacterium]